SWGLGFVEPPRWLMCKTSCFDFLSIYMYIDVSSKNKDIVTSQNIYGSSVRISHMSDHIEDALKHVKEKIDEYCVKTLEYYFEDGSHVIFEKYTIDTLGVIRHKESGKTPSYGNGGYNECIVLDDAGKPRHIRIARTVASTFIGKPPTSSHTADHIESEQKKNDTLQNIRWLCKPGQRDNQKRPETAKSAFFIIKDGVEKTAKEWVAHLNASKAPKDHKFTANMIRSYAQKNQHGFAYKVYDNFPGEKWLKISWSKNGKGAWWEISDMNRMKYVTASGAENILEGDDLCIAVGYPAAGINGKQWFCHVLAFMTFRETEWELKKPDEMVLHKKDDKMDFRPHMLWLGTHSNNRKDSYDNGKRDDTKSARMKCASYINGIKEEEFNSQTDAAKFIKTKGVSKSSVDGIKTAICMALSGERLSAYKRIWKKL
ncbi:hypothetical protein PBCVCan184_092R, partial [Paramecium bursaria Chlorella virus Can18-4]